MLFHYPPELIAPGESDEAWLLRSTEPARSSRGVYGIVAKWHVDESVRILRGDRMRNWAALYDEVSAAFQFPLYFGNNAGALNESLREPDQEPVSTGRTCIIVAADQVLAEEPTEQMGWFVGCLQDARRDWVERPPEHLEGVVPFFTTVLAPMYDDDAGREAIQRRWSAAGARIREFWA